jgi:hypothetical protein
MPVFGENRRARCRGGAELAKARLLFVNKKKQKTLLCWAMGCVADNARGPAQQKFLRRFF